MTSSGASLELGRVTTAATPSSARASCASTERCARGAKGLRTKATWSIPGSADVVEEARAAAQQRGSSTRGEAASDVAERPAHDALLRHGAARPRGRRRRCPGSRCSGRRCPTGARGSRPRVGCGFASSSACVGQQHARRAEAALEAVLRAERLLDRVQLAGSRQPVDGLDRPHPSACTASTRHESVSRPSSSTVHAPQPPCSQATCTLVSPSSCRRKSASSSRGSARRGSLSSVDGRGSRAAAQPSPSLGLLDRRAGRATAATRRRYAPSAWTSDTGSRPGVASSAASAAAAPIIQRRSASTARTGVPADTEQDDARAGRAG